MNKNDLLDWSNLAAAGTRFPESEYKCPKCGGETLEDIWPPNYGGMKGCFSVEDGSSNFESSGSVKCICLNCALFFVVSYWEKTINGKTVERKEAIHDETPLVELNGKYLTPHDVWRENYKEEHGEYPSEAYA